MMVNIAVIRPLRVLKWKLSSLISAAGQINNFVFINSQKSCTGYRHEVIYDYHMCLIFVAEQRKGHSGVVYAQFTFRFSRPLVIMTVGDVNAGVLDGSVHGGI